MSGIKNVLGQDNEPTPTYKPVAGEVADYARDLAKGAEELYERVVSKLHPVMRQETQANPAGISRDISKYPPLFADLHASLTIIESSIESIQDALTRTEL